jgi:hypothetical protein
MIIGYSLAPSLWHSNQTCKSFDESDKFAKIVVILWLHMSSNFEMYFLSKVKKCLMWKLSRNEVKMFVCILHVLYFSLNSFTWPLHTKDMDLHLHSKWFHIDQITLHHGHLHRFGWNFIHLHINELPYLLHMYECLS